MSEQEGLALTRTDAEDVVSASTVSEQEEPGLTRTDAEDVVSASTVSEQEGLALTRMEETNSLSAVGEHALTIQTWYRECVALRIHRCRSEQFLRIRRNRSLRAPNTYRFSLIELALQRRHNRAVIHIQALCRGILCRRSARKSSCCGSKRKPIRHLKMDFMDQESGYLSEHYVTSYSEAMELFENEKDMSFDDAIECILVRLHFSRRKSHSTSWKWVKHCVVAMLRDAKAVKKNCKVMYRKDRNHTPYLVMTCPKHKGHKVKECKQLFEISELVSSMEKLATDFRASHPEISAEFEQVADQLKSGEMHAMHILAPHRVTMCPGNCIGSSGMFVPESIWVYNRRCGDARCHSCPIITIREAVRVMICPNGCCKKADEPLRWCLECGGDHAPNARCDHRARWKLLPDDTKEYLEGKIAVGEAQHCPNCFAVQEKSSGCDKLKCPECGTKFCLKCGDVLDGNYVTNHLFPLQGGRGGNNSLICRRTVVLKAFAGENLFVREVVSAYRNGHSNIIADVRAIAQDIDLSTVPHEIVALLPQQGGAGGSHSMMGQIELDAIIAYGQMLMDEVD